MVTLSYRSCSRWEADHPRRPGSGSDTRCAIQSTAHQRQCRELESGQRYLARCNGTLQRNRAKLQSSCDR
eukprot:9258589-Lingulodinium_polyedra.AAC.1